MLFAQTSTEFLACSLILLSLLLIAAKRAANKVGPDIKEAAKGGIIRILSNVFKK